MAGGPRYAVYFVPEPGGELYRFGSSWLGYDCYSGFALARRSPPAINADAAEQHTREPRNYGFHGTLKAPFHLDPAYREADLIVALEAFSARALTFDPSVELLDAFVAIVPAARCDPLESLAADCVRHFDRYRAPLSEQDRQRRTAAGLTSRQCENLDTWGYPYVFEDFRFHMTLTGRLAQETRHQILAALRGAFNEAVGWKSVSVDRIVLLRQEEGEPFTVLRSAEFRGG